MDGVKDLTVKINALIFSVILSQAVAKEIDNLNTWLKNGKIK